MKKKYFEPRIKVRVVNEDTLLQGSKDVGKIIDDTTTDDKDVTSLAKHYNVWSDEDEDKK